ESVRQSRADAKAAGERWRPLRREAWSPLGKEVRESLSDREISLSAEKAVRTYGGWFNLFFNGASKTTLGDVDKVLTPPKKEETPPKTPLGDKTVTSPPPGGNGADTTPLGDAGKVQTIPSAAFTHFAGFAGGTAASFAGYAGTDAIFGKHIGFKPARKFV